ncbi:hypothetical protein [Agromyces archimandritae]|uniref:NTP pyrophosphohydrolase n=1 Tax=Agromyces archimandritae TaxID=2781962 RepID=A0A975IMU8_9MICO|nr:hypothetical protein [Agromyces archimandritae]QTX03845.1 hypothetical protein G127AT_11010 [Agromyces archimandritae]
MQPVPGLRLVVDVANVVGSVPDGWWRDRAGAATRLLARLAPLVGATVTGPDGGQLRIDAVTAVVEGRASTAEAPPELDLVVAPADGDSEIVAFLGGDGTGLLVITADRGLRDRLPPGTRVAGPGWLNGLIGR